MYLNGKKVDKLPREAIDKMCANISRTVSEYFAQHPEQFDPWMKSMGYTPLPDEGTQQQTDSEHARLQ